MELLNRTTAENVKTIASSKTFEKIDVKSILLDIVWELEDLYVADIDVNGDALKIEFADGQTFTVTVA